ncbi:hypothetical protein WR25_26176 [Diploscapter pachys]|uniref:Protein orai n=1 Tax=Diploscapter pachys TaxID=2018661 RepID=A0A2A2J6H3_9BILA|nr:hypothetical protein WR25_26176 [Diploscapter pachys]
MPKTDDPTKVSLLKNSRRISISVENVEALTTWQNALDAVQQSTSDASNSNQMTIPIIGKKSTSVTGSLQNGKLEDRASIQSGATVPPSWQLPQFYLQPPSGGSRSSSAYSLHPEAPKPNMPRRASILLGHRGELDMAEKYNYDLSKAQLKASSRTSALLAGFAMVALVELQYDEKTPHILLIILGIVTSLLVSVHLLALMMSTCILPYMEATGCTQDSPHIKLKFYIDLSWLFSTCIGLLLFLVEIGIIFFVKFDNVGYRTAGYITTAMIVPVIGVFVVFSYLIHKNRVTHSLGRFKDKVNNMRTLLDVEANIQKQTLTSGAQGVQNI